jgi:hypothetical protein
MQLILSFKEPDNERFKVFSNMIDPYISLANLSPQNEIG